MLSDIPAGTKAVLIDQGGEVIAGHLLLPDGSRVELPPEAVGSRKQAAPTSTDIASDNPQHRTLTGHAHECHASRPQGRT
jgi:hypothetical protein